VSDKALSVSAVDPDVQKAMVLYSRMKPMKDALGCQNLTDAEFQLFAMVCNHTGLDPFTKQIYAVKRGGRVTHQTGIDGYRSTAADTKEYRGSEEATYEDCGCGDEDSPPNHPSVSRVVVRRATPEGTISEQVGVARWHELKPPHTRKDDKSAYEDAMWWRMPFNQLSKCAEANGLRKLFPRILGGTYISEEMQQANVIEGAATEVTPRQSAKERLAAKRAAAEAKAAVVKPEEATETVTEEIEDDISESELEFANEAIEGDAVETPVWGATAPADAPPPCPKGHGPMAVSNWGGWWCRTKDCKEKVRG
jgi:phage recombination protein Bet